MVIYYKCPDVNSPVGGVKQIYRHVDILNKNNIGSAVWHNKNNFRVDWFKNNTKVVNSPAIKKEDFVVYPEIYGSKILDDTSIQNKIIFNQGAYLTFTNISPSEEKNPYHDKSVKATFVVSEDSKEYIKYAFPETRVFRIHNGIDKNYFNYTDEKKKQITYTPRRLPKDIKQVLGILTHHDKLKDYSVVELDGLSEKDMSKKLKNSLFFLSTSFQEGCPLPPAEAMACGCIVVGYHGRGGKEYMKNKFSYPIDYGNIVKFTKTLERLIDKNEKNPSNLLNKGKKASNFILRNYSLEREEKDVLESWNKILKEQGHS